MKKILAFISLTMVLCLFGANAQPFFVEKVSNAKANGKKLSAGQVLYENTTIKIEDGGYILFVDNNNHMRYYINTSCNEKVRKLIKKAGAPMKVTKSYLESLFTQNQDKDRASSAGSTHRGVDDGAPELSDFALTGITRGDEMPDSVPEPIGVNVLTTTKETISIYYIIP